MIAYNKTWLANLRLCADVKKNYERGNITAAEFAAISQKHPVGFYTPAVLVRVGLFILTLVIVVFADGLLSLLATSSTIVDGFGWFFFLGALSYLVLEVMVNAKFHYRSGVDDALLFISACLFTIGFFVMFSGTENYLHYTPQCCLIFLLTLFFSLRFTDMLMSAVCSLALSALIFFAWKSIGAIGFSTVPFVIMIASVVVYRLSYIYQKRLLDYEECLDIVQLICLVTLYGAGNYYIVQTFTDEVTGQVRPIAFAPFFWAWTVLLPFVYLYFGLKKKDEILLRIGLLLIAAAVGTFRYYYHILPTDVVLTLAGTLLLGVVYTVMKYLETPKHGFTYEVLDEKHPMDSLKIESLVVAETFSHIQAAPADEGTKFGGGDFGGGGSSADF